MGHLCFVIDGGNGILSVWKTLLTGFFHEQYCASGGHGKHRGKEVSWRNLEGL